MTQTSKCFMIKSCFIFHQKTCEFFHCKNTLLLSWKFVDLLIQFFCIDIECFNDLWIWNQILYHLNFINQFNWLSINLFEYLLTQLFLWHCRLFFFLTLTTWWFTLTLIFTNTTISKYCFIMMFGFLSRRIWTCTLIQIKFYLIRTVLTMFLSLVT